MLGLFVFPLPKICLYVASANTPTLSWRTLNDWAAADTHLLTALLSTLLTRLTSVCSYDNVPS